MSEIKYRNLFVQVLLMIITFGLYGIYWFYQSAKELKSLDPSASDAQPGLWTILLFVPFGCIYSWYQYSCLFEKAGHEKINKGILFLLWFFFSPAVWFLVQTDLNNRAQKIQIQSPANG